MISIGEIRARAYQNVVKQAYWQALGFCILFSLIIGGIGNIFKITIRFDEIYSDNWSVILSVFSIANIVGVMARLFLNNILMLGLNKYFLDGAKTETFDFGAIGYGFQKENYLSVVKGMFLKDLLLLAWGILLLIPVVLLFIFEVRNFLIINIYYIIVVICFYYKYYSYSLVPYLFSENTDLGARKAIYLSKKMAHGYIKKLFLLDISFFIWPAIIMFASFAFSILGLSSVIMFLGIIILLIYVVGILPYYQSARAYLYLELKSLESNSDIVDDKILKVIE